MNCPFEIADVLLDLIHLGIRESRAAATLGDQAAVTREADHLSNLTHLLHDYTDDLLSFYWEVERIAFLRQLSAERRIGWEPHWERLREHAEARNYPFEMIAADCDLGPGIAKKRRGLILVST